MGIVNEWIIRTRAVMARSAQLRALDQAVNAWATGGQGPGDANMKATWDRLQAWRTAQPAELARLSAQSGELEAELANKWTAKPKQIAGVKAEGVKPEGWVKVDYNPAVHGGSLLPERQRVPPLTSSEIQRINESVRRAKFAAIAARDALIKVADAAHFAGPALAPAARAYLDFFGAFDAGRFSTVLQNLTALAIAFGQMPQFIDCRNRTIWADTYGGCVRRNLVRRPQGRSRYTGQIVHTGTSVAGSVTMLIGRAFLGKGDYAQTTDATVGTMVHEFSHGTVNAVDVPEVNAAGIFQCARVSDDPAHADFGNSIDPFAHQASTEADDMLLAQFHPAYAIVNADSYGQFTRRILTAKGE